MSEQNETTRQRRGAGRALATFFILILIVAGALVSAGYVLNSAPARALSGPVSFRIAQGESVASIAGRLEDLGIIRSALALRMITRLEGTSRRVQSGNYLFTDRFSAREMHEYLLSGNQVLRRVTIPEGLTVTRVASIVEDAGITMSSAFLQATGDPDLLAEFSIPGSSAEGYLYPDTYLFAEGLPAEAVVSHMIGRFFEVAREVYPELGELSATELHERVVLASIVEREYRVAEEAPTIASVFFNRLEVNMRLESCATVVYVMTEIEGLGHPQRLFYRDLERENPYNTYRSAGLPPGPIANPGRTSLNAVFYPDTTDYRFFVWNGPGSGSHAFTRTLSEHNEARLLHLKSP